MIVLLAITLAGAALISYLVLEVPVAAPIPGGHGLLLFCPLAPLPCRAGRSPATGRPRRSQR
ncbi:MAG TPA: hypothetical protein VMU39_01240 [Solirubrobacteraceae bacterium]|nr:hypothetical protein [Solirubrobacteraceae bacterium]